MIVTISGASGVGKSAVMDALLRRIPESQPLVSCTTRDPRPTDLPREYLHFTDAEFDAEIAERRFLWIGEAHGARYGRHKNMVRRALETDHAYFVGTLSLDVIEALLAFADQHGQRSAVHSFYIFSPSEEILRARLIGRGDNPASVEGRIADCRGWDEEARRAIVPFHAIQDRDDLEEKVRAVLAHLPR